MSNEPKSFIIADRPAQGVTVEIAGIEHVFYAMSLKTVFELRAVAKPILASLAALFTPQQPSVKETVRSGIGEKEIVKQTFEPASAEIVKLGSSTREKALADLVDAFLDPKNAALLRLVITDSLRDEFARPVRLTKEQERIFEELDLPTAVAFLGAVVQANREVFGPLVNGVTEAQRALTPVIQTPKNGSTSSS